jgi:hypothetical protein
LALVAAGFASGERLLLVCIQQCAKVRDCIKIAYKGVIPMVDKTIKIKKKKRLSKGQRTHVRRQKQEAGKTSPIPK